MWSDAARQAALAAREANGSHQTGVNQVGRQVVADKLMSAIQGNPDGFTVALDGSSPKGGYMVSLPGHTQIVNARDLTGPNGRGIINDYVTKNLGALMGPHMHVGGWTDKQTGKTYLDVSENVPSRFSASKKGRMRNQIAIYDVKRQREIRTGGTGE